MHKVSFYKKEKNLNVGTLFKKAKNEIHGQPFKF